MDTVHRDVSHHNSINCLQSTYALYHIVSLKMSGPNAATTFGEQGASLEAVDYDTESLTNIQVDELTEEPPSRHRYSSFRGLFDDQDFLMMI